MLFNELEIIDCHHAYGMYKKLKLTAYTRREKLVRISLSVLFQFCYTTLFGIYASYIFLNSLGIQYGIGAFKFFNLALLDCGFYNVYISHMICNVFGFPGFEFLTDGSSWTRKGKKFTYCFAIINFYSSYDCVYLSIRPFSVY